MSDNRCANAAEYRQQARQARTVAHLVSISAVRRQLLEEARSYDTLADGAEAQELVARKL